MCLPFPPPLCVQVPQPAPTRTTLTAGAPQAVAELAGSIAQGRAQARSLLLIDLERPPADYLPLCASLAPGQLSVLDCFSDPFGWLTRAATHPKAVAAAADATAAAAAARSAAPQSVAGVTMLAGVLQQPGGLQQLLQAAAPSAVPAGQAPAPRRCIVVDSLSRLLDSFGPRAVAHWLHQLQCAASTSCVLCALHADLHPPQVLASLRLLAAGWAEVQPLLGSDRAVCSAPTGAGTGGGAAAGAAAPVPHGRVSVRLKRRAGRVRVEEQLFRVDPRAGQGVVSYWAAPPALSTPQALAGSAAPAVAAGTAAGGVCRQGCVQSVDVGGVCVLQGVACGKLMASGPTCTALAGCDAPQNELQAANLAAAAAARQVPYGLWRRRQQQLGKVLLQRQHCPSRWRGG